MGFIGQFVRLKPVRKSNRQASKQKTDTNQIKSKKQGGAHLRGTAVGECFLHTHTHTHT